MKFEYFKTQTQVARDRPLFQALEKIKSHVGGSYKSEDLKISWTDRTLKYKKELVWTQNDKDHNNNGVWSGRYSSFNDATIDMDDK